jgi:PilZ domain
MVAPERPERRHDQRKKLAVEAELHAEGYAAPLRVKTSDLSTIGCYVEMMFTLEVGAKLQIGLWINGVKLNTEGVVSTRDLQVGNGIEFIGMAVQDREMLKQFLADAPDS